MNAQKSSSGKIRREIKNHGKKRCIGIFAAVLSSVLLISPVCIFAAESAAAAGVGSTGAETAEEAETAAESAAAAGVGSTGAETAAEAETASESAAAAGGGSTGAETAEAETAAESTAAAGVGSTGAETAAEAETASESATAAGVGSTGAETAAEEPPVNSADIAYVHLAGEPGNPDPFRVMDTDTASMLGLISEGLTAIDENGDIIPGCAKRWSVSEDGLEWKFRLRRDLCWSDGDSLEAEDFAELFRKIADPSSEVLYGQDLVRNIAGYEEVLNGDSDALDVHAEGKRTLIVRLSAPDPAFARVCASRTLLPIREQIRNEHDQEENQEADQETGDQGTEDQETGKPGTEDQGTEDQETEDQETGDQETEDREKEDKEESEDSPADWENVTGNGPYRIISHEPGKETVLEKNPFYKNPDRPGEPFEKVIWKYEGDSNREYSDLLNGEIDAIAEIPAEIKTGTQAFFTAETPESEKTGAGKPAVSAAETAGSEKTGSGKPAVSAAETAGSEGTVTETGMRAYFAGTAEENAESDSAPVYQTQIVLDLLGILFNCNNEALGDMRVRRALSLAVDRAYLASVILDGMYAPAEDFTGILTGSAAAKTEDAESTKDASDGSGETERTGSFAEAKKLLEEAGYAASHGAGEEFPVLTCIADENGAAFLAAEYLASAWNELGIEVRVKTADPDEIAQEKKAGTFDMICGNVFLSSDLPAAELGRFVSESAENASGFSSGEYDLLLETAFQETDADRYDEELQGAARLLAVEIPSAPLAVRSVSWMSRRDSTGIFCDPTGCWQLWKQPEPAAGETAEEESLTAGAGGGTGGGMPETRSGQSSFSTEGGNSIKDGDSIKDEKNAFSGFFMNTAADTAETQGESFFSLAKKSDFYFERADTDAWLTQQAWVLDDVGSKGNRVVSLPKYTTVHLNGMGNDRYVRMVIDGKFHYLTADSVTTDPAALEAIRETEQERILQREIIAAPIHQAKEIELSARAQEIREETERILAEIAFQEALRTQTRNPNWDGPVLSRSKGSVYGPSGKETYYNLNMSGVVNIMRRMGNTDEYWVRDDGCKMLGNYIMCAANLRVHPRGSLVECSLGTCIVCDTGGFASHNANQLDIAVTW